VIYHQGETEYENGRCYKIHLKKKGGSYNNGDNSRKESESKKITPSGKKVS
jgi:hypothetical protein